MINRLQAGTYLERGEGRWSLVTGKAHSHRASRREEYGGMWGEEDGEAGKA